MSKNIWFLGSKGGAGTTVTVALFASVLAKRGDIVAVIGGPDMAAALGCAFYVPPGEGLTVAPLLRFFPDHDELDITDLDITADYVLIDGDRNLPPAQFDGETILVTRACYMALRAVVDKDYGTKVDGVIVVLEPGRALSAEDVSDVVGFPLLATIPVDPAVARAVDAGLLTSRQPRDASRSVLALVTP